MPQDRMSLAHSIAQQLEWFAADFRSICSESDVVKRNKEYDEMRRHLFLVLNDMNELYGDRVYEEGRDIRRRIDEMIERTRRTAIAARQYLSRTETPSKPSTP